MHIYAQLNSYFPRNRGPLALNYAHSLGHVGKNDEFCVLNTRNCVLKTRNLAFKMMNFAVVDASENSTWKFDELLSWYFVLNMMNFVSEMMNFALKTRNCVFKMMNFAGR